MIKIIAIGKLKEKYLIDLCNDYIKRINKYHKLEVIEAKDELEIITKYLDNKDYKVALKITGKELSTIKFKEFIETKFKYGQSNITFIIGASEGLSDNFYKLVNESISFSKLTFPHGLFRGILLEQIYRVFKIINNEKYHK